MGVRDPLAVDPNALLAGSSLDPTRIVGRWEPYQAGSTDEDRSRNRRVSFTVGINE